MRRGGGYVVVMTFLNFAAHVNSGHAELMSGRCSLHRCTFQSRQNSMSDDFLRTLCHDVRVCCLHTSPNSAVDETQSFHDQSNRF